MPSYILLEKKNNRVKNKTNNVDEKNHSNSGSRAFP